MSKISELSDGGAIQSGDTLIAVRSGGNVKVTYGGTTTANIDGGTIDGTVIGGSSAAAGTFTSITGTSANINGTVTADGLTVDGTARIEETGAAARLIIARADNANSADSASLDLLENASANQSFGAASAFGFRLEVDGSTNKFNIVSGNGVTTADRFTIGRDTGDISFYEDTGTTAKFFWDASAEALAIGHTVTSHALSLANTKELAFLDNTGASRATLTIDASNYIQMGSAGGGLAGYKFDLNGSNAVTIDNSRRVGIGTTSPVSPLHILNAGTTAVSNAIANSGVVLDGGSGNIGLNLVTPDTGAAYINFGDSTDSNVGRIIYNHNTNALTFDTNGAERARLDSSGNWLVGKTSTSYTTAGTIIEPAGRYVASYDGGIAGVFARLTSDGDIVQFRKDGTAVGSIGSIGGVTSYIDGGSTYTGLAFNASSIAPRDAGAGTNGTVDLGVSSGRWKDLYLSGGVYLGGTGAANLLDDYEEGTFTPVIADASTGGNTGTAGTLQGNYVKVGGLVTVRMFIVNVDTTGLTSTNELVIRNLPFANYNASNQTVSVGSCRLDQITFSGNYVTPEVNGAGNYLVFKETVSGSADVGVLVSSVNSGSSDIFLTLTYQTLE